MASPHSERLLALLPADALLLGEQHDAPAHHDIERDAVQTLAAHGRLAALAVEMAEEGGSTAQLPADASEEQIRAALNWSEKSWPWPDYGPAIVAAVRAGVPVLGANLPRARMRDAMADASIYAHLDTTAVAAQEEAVREGHCNLLPEPMIQPMARVQIARDRAMARTVAQARSPGRTVLLIAGAGHVDKQLGVPRHLPADLSFKAVQLRAQAADAPDSAGASDAANPARRSFDSVWTTPAPPPRDHCARLRNLPPAADAR